MMKMHMVPMNTREGIESICLPDEKSNRENKVLLKRKLLLITMLIVVVIVLLIVLATVIHCYPRNILSHFNKNRRLK